MCVEYYRKRNKNGIRRVHIAHLKVNNSLTAPTSHHTCNCSIIHKLTATYRDIFNKNVPVYDYSMNVCYSTQMFASSLYNDKTVIS